MASPTPWDVASAAYLARYPFDDVDINYGPWAQREAELGLLGDFTGLSVLDAGCGGGHNSVALARRGANVVGIDGSILQLNAARQRAELADVQIDFRQIELEEISAFPVETFDIILANYVLPYIEGISTVLTGLAMALKPGGRLVAAMDHPIRAMFIDVAEDDLSVFPLNGYFRPMTQPVRFAQLDVRLQTYHRTIDQWITALSVAGFTLARVIEPVPPQDLLDELWPEDGALAPLRLLPHALIFEGINAKFLSG